jgi:hypothetical protein
LFSANIDTLSIRFSRPVSARLLINIGLERAAGTFLWRNLRTNYTIM